MIGKHLLLTLRSLRRNLLYAILVITGLALGITTFLSTIQWSAWHLTFDRDFPREELIYRLTFEENREGFYRHTARILHGNALNKIIFTDMLPGIELSGRLAPFRKGAFIIGDRTFYEEHTYACDPTFLEIFQPGVISGEREGMLDAPFTMILTRSAATRFFGDEDPVGQSLELMHQFDSYPTTYSVTAVIEDFPPNSHFRISVLTSFEDPVKYTWTAWTYLKLQGGADPRQTEEDIRQFITSNIDEPYAQRLQPRLQPVTDIHLKSHKAREIQPNVRFRTVLILITAGMLVFLLAWFNFTLLSFSQNQLNIQQLVIQWQMGAGKRNFLFQFILDNLLVGVIAFAGGILLTFLLSPSIQQLGGIPVARDPGILAFSILLLSCSSAPAQY